MAHEAKSGRFPAATSPLHAVPRGDEKAEMEPHNGIEGENRSGGLRGDKTLAELSAAFDINANQIVD
ncbi:MAG: hypothetical protein HYV02_03830 [Deltaproteobacteria bacterium]|nr:hypothetical protein [Deltaproteobacteria bacterium]